MRRREMFWGVDLGFVFAHFYCIVTEFNHLDGGERPAAFISKVSSLQQSSERKALKAILK